MGQILLHSAWAIPAFLILWIPGWWLSGRLLDARGVPFFRLLLSFGLLLGGYLSGVNLIGRLLENSLWAFWAWLILNSLACLVLWRRRKAELGFQSVLSTWRNWSPVVLVALICAFPQWILAVSTNYWDEAASSAIHITGANQFAEGVFPPRHNAFPDITVKYHYAFIILSGTVKWLTGLSANASIDLASTALWLFIFLFLFFWLEELRLKRFSAFAGSFAVLLGGGFSWAYVPWLQAYGGFRKIPDPSLLLRRHDASSSWVDNLLEVAGKQNFHLRNSDGSLSSLPLEVANYFQQHAVPVGMAFTLLALYMFVAWLKREEFNLPLLVGNILLFSLLFLAHAVFGAVACISAGLFLLGLWLRRRTKANLLNGLLFAMGVSLMAFAQGGMFSLGPEYGEAGFLKLRSQMGYWEGGLRGFIHWNLAGFGLPLLVTLAAWGVWARRNPNERGPRKSLIGLMTIFGLVSYIIPQLFFYSYGGSDIEQSTEVSKFFFCTRFSLSILLAFAVALLPRSLPKLAVLGAFLIMAATPLAVCYAGAFGTDHQWNGFYSSPYAWKGGRVQAEMGRAFGRLKKSSRDVYFDSSADEAKHGFLSELLVYAGSAFTLTPSRFERTGGGYRLSAQRVADRYRLNSRMARLRPGAAEEARCSWYYSRPQQDLAQAPLIVRSRFQKLVAQGYFEEEFQSDSRILYAIRKPTSDLDQGLEGYWSPKVIAQAKTDWDGDGKGDLIFYDYLSRAILIGDTRIALPGWLQEEYSHLYVGSFPGERRVDLLLARLADTHYQLGGSIDELVQYNGIFWTYRDSYSGHWQPEYRRWLWDKDMPLIADLDGDGFDTYLAYRHTDGQWRLHDGSRIAGPKMAADSLAFPLSGRFLPGSSGDLGLWSVKTGLLMLQSVHGGQSQSFAWGGQAGDFLVPGDYDGDGYDEAGVFQPQSLTWFTRRISDGYQQHFRFGSASGIPLPADYDHDGRLDLAYWEPSQNKILVSFDHGRTIGRTIQVPPHSIPAFVNMY